MIADAPINAAANPWRTIWFSPRQTMRELKAASTRPSWVPVYLLGLVGGIFDRANTWWADRNASRASIAVITVLMIALSLLSLWSAPLILRGYGRWRGGVGTTPQLRAALAWASAPIALSMFFWVPIWIANGGALNPDTPDEGAAIAIVLLLVTYVMHLWSAVILVAALAEVQQFSVWRSLDSLVMLVFTLGIALLIAAVAIMKMLPT